MVKWVKVSCPGTCGELFQGYLGDKEYLVTLPIKRYSHIYLTESTSLELLVGYKAQQAFFLTCQLCGVKKDDIPHIRLTRQSELSVGKGMASSTADIIATIYATATYLDQSLTEDMVMALCCQIEKTDSLIYPQLTVMAPTDGQVYHQASWFPCYRLVILEGQESLDTEKFHRCRDEELAQRQSEAYQQLFEGYQTALNNRSAKQLAEIATASSRLNQQLLNKPLFKKIESLAKDYDALGVMVAHSGTVLALMFSLDQTIPAELYNEFKKQEFQCNYSYSYEVETTRGGVTILTNDN